MRNIIFSTQHSRGMKIKFPIVQECERYNAVFNMCMLYVFTINTQHNRVTTIKQSTDQGSSEIKAEM